MSENQISLTGTVWRPVHLYRFNPEEWQEFVLNNPRLERIARGRKQELLTTRTSMHSSPLRSHRRGSREF
jgi:hypothetical protein